MNRAQRTTFAFAVIATSLVLELAIQLDWSQEITGWSVAAAIGATLALKGFISDRRDQTSTNS